MLLEDLPVIDDDDETVEYQIEEEFQIEEEEIQMPESESEYEEEIHMTEIESENEDSIEVNESVGLTYSLPGETQFVQFDTVHIRVRKFRANDKFLCYYCVDKFLHDDDRMFGYIHTIHDVLSLEKANDRYKNEKCENCCIGLMNIFKRKDCPFCQCDTCDPLSDIRCMKCICDSLEYMETVRYLKIR